MQLNKHKRIIALFDIDGTLTESRKKITPEMKNHMKKLAEIITVGVIGGSDMAKHLLTILGMIIIRFLLMMF
jgi:phosphomannomutase